MKTSTPIHEAGHAIVARRFTGGPVRAFLRAGPGGGGTTEYLMPTATPNRMEAIRRQVIVLLSGVAGELIAAGRDPLGPAPLLDIARRILLREQPPYERGRGTSDRNAYEWLLGLLEEEYGDKLTAHRAADSMLRGCLQHAVSVLREERTELEHLSTRIATERDVQY